MNYKRIFTVFKTYIRRSTTYISLANSIMILFIFLKNIGLSVTRFMIPIIIITMFGLIFAGWLEDRLGLHEDENEFNMIKNPVAYETLEIVRRLENKNES